MSEEGPGPEEARALAVSEAVKEGILQSSLDCIVTMDATGSVVDFNPAAERTFGYARADAVGRALGGLIVPERHRQAHQEGLERQLATGRSKILDRRVELTAMRADGSEFPVELTVTRIDAGDSPVFAGYIRDLTDRRRAEERIARLATHDQLTGLPNRRLLCEHLEVGIRRAEQNGGGVALLHLDLNRFGMVNESLGRAGGDEVLRRVAARLDGLDPVQVVARETGDEFLLVVEVDAHSTAGAGIHEAIGRALASTVLGALARPLALGDRDVELGAHVGISLYPADAGDVDTLLDHAEVALREGRLDRVDVNMFAPREERRTGDRLAFVTDLRGALGRGEFQLHYQPIVDLPAVWELRARGREGLNSAVVGVEALLRWRHAERGLVGPNDFIPVLEDSGMMVGVGQWVVAEACSQASRWSEAGLVLNTAVNLSLRELASDGITDRLVDEVGRAGIDPADLTVEITETAAMTDPDRMAGVLDQIASAGFPLAIDDFGTGHSSLSRLWRIAVSTLKIDRSFISAVIDNPAAGTMVTAIIRLAEGLGVRTLAEGIETDEELQFLVTQGCTLGQGFLFSRPLPADEVTALIAG